MELAKITSKGQITIPAAIRKLLGLKEGDKVLFIQEGSKVVMMNASVNALLEIQKDFEGAAAAAGTQRGRVRFPRFPRYLALRMMRER